MNLSDISALAGRAAAIARPSTAGRSARWFDIRAGVDRTAVHLYGEIGGFDNPAADFVRALADVTNPVDLHINSGGGFVFDGLAIYAALRNHVPGVTTYVDGIAASAASVVAMAGSEIVMEKPAKMMIHDASGGVIGNAENMREMADLLDTMSDTLADIYTEKAGGKRSDWRAAMRATTWYSSADAVRAGLADRVAKAPAAPKAVDTATQLIRARHSARVKG
jgi:ATP-dependent protease ClpP protease subunit